MASIELQHVSAPDYHPQGVLEQSNTSTTRMTLIGKQATSELATGTAHYQIILKPQHCNFLLITFTYFTILIFESLQ